MKKIILIITSILGLFNETIAQTTSDNLSKELSELYGNSQLSGFAVAIVNADSVLYGDNFGYEDVKSKKMFSAEQRFYVASISKTFIGISLMKLVESGELELSTPINSILPFKVTNPYFTKSKITVEHLARHTSSILYDGLELKSWYLDNKIDLEIKDIGKSAFKDFSSWDKNKEIELGVFLEECLSLEGNLYSKKLFSKNKPGEKYEYSNLGAALAAYIIELKTGIDYREYIENFAEEELGLPTGIWRKTVTEEIPTNYFQNKVKTPVHKSNLYPTGGMMLSGKELSNYLTEMIRGFQGKSSILKPKSFQKMMSSQNTGKEGNGIFWELNGDKIGHNGGNYGVTCFMSFNKTTGIGKVFITNISSYQDDKLLKEMIGIWNKMGEFETKL